ncbi:MAG: glycosyltransferase [Verrucomicrobiales bacterium]
MSEITEALLPLTVLTPVFRGRRFLEACVEGVAAEADGRLEHLVIDGGSDDGSVEVLESLAKKYSHLRWLSEGDQGQSDAMNKGIAMAKGRFLGILNVDDHYEPGALKRVLGLMEAMPSADKPLFLLGLCQWWAAPGVFKELSQAGDYSLFRSLMGAFPPNPACYFYEKSLHDLIGPYDVADHQTMDLDFLIRARRQVELRSYDELWGHFVMHEDCKTASAEQDEVLEARKHETIERNLAKLPLHLRLGFGIFRWCETDPRARQARFYARHPRAIGGKIRALLSGRGL